MTLCKVLIHEPILGTTPATAASYSPPLTLPRYNTLDGVQRVDANHKTQQIELVYDQVRRELALLDYQVEQTG